MSLSRSEKNTPYAQKNFKILPESIGIKIKKILTKNNIPLVYDANLDKFSKQGNRFSTLNQLKILLQPIKDNLNISFDNSLFKQEIIALTKEEKVTLRNTSRVTQFAIALQEEYFSPSDLRVLRRRGKRDITPLLSTCLMEKSLTPLQYKQLLFYIGKNINLVHYEKEISEIIMAGEIDNLLKIIKWRQSEYLEILIANGHKHNLITFMKREKTEDLIDIMRIIGVYDIKVIMDTGHTNNLIKILEEN